MFGFEIGDGVCLFVMAAAIIATTVAVIRLIRRGRGYRGKIESERYRSREEHDRGR